MYHLFQTILRSAVTAAMLAVFAGMATAETAAETVAPLNVTADGVAMDGFDVVAYFTDGAPAKGNASHAIEYQGAQWLFSSAEHAARFSADPARYAPRNNGWCSYAVSEGYAADVDFIEGWSVIDGALFLNYSEDVRAEFLSTKDRRIPATKTNWPTVAAGLADGSITPYRHADDPAVGIAHPQTLE
jgi:YHS domain-containing protein